MEISKIAGFGRTIYTMPQLQDKNTWAFMCAKCYGGAGKTQARVDHAKQKKGASH